MVENPSPERNILVRIVGTCDYTRSVLGPRRDRGPSTLTYQTRDPPPNYSSEVRVGGSTPVSRYTGVRVETFSEVFCDRCNLVSLCLSLCVDFARRQNHGETVKD